MTIEELGIILGGISSHYINHHWKQIYNSWSKRGLILIKNGKGLSANYGILKKGELKAKFNTEEIFNDIEVILNDSNL